MILEDVNSKVLRKAKINFNLSEDVSKLLNDIYILKIISKKHIQNNKLFKIQH